MTTTPIPSQDDAGLREVLKNQKPIATAISALRFLAENGRPNGGQAEFNSEHLYQIAGELAAMRRLVPAPGGGDVLRDALANIARQKLTTEMDAEWRDEGDFEGAYDTIIEIARKALAIPTPPVPSSDGAETLDGAAIMLMRGLIEIAPNGYAKRQAEQFLRGRAHKAATPSAAREVVIEECAKWVEHEAVLASRSALGWRNTPCRDRRDEEDYERHAKESDREKDRLKKIAAGLRRLAQPASEEKS